MRAGRSTGLGLLGLAALLVLLWLGGRDALDSIASADPVYLALAFGTTVAVTAVSSWRWAVLTGLFVGGGYGPLLPFYRSLVLSRAAGLFIPQGASDFALRPLLHRVSAGGPASSSFAGVTVERVADGTLVIAAGVPAALYVLGPLGETGHWGVLAAALGVWALCFAFLGQRALRWTAGAAEALACGADGDGLKQRTKGLLSKAGASLREASGHNVALRHAAALSVLRYVLISLQFTLIAYALDLDDVGVLQVVAALPLAQLGAIVAVTPGGIGFVEGGFFGSLDLMEVSGESVATFLVGQRVLISVFILTLGAVALASALLKPNRHRLDAADVGQTEEGQRPA